MDVDYLYKPSITIMPKVHEGLLGLFGVQLVMATRRVTNVLGLPATAASRSIMGWKGGV